MIKDLRLLMTLVLAVLGLQSVQAQFTKADLTADGWAEITELPTPLEDYFFVFEDATQEFMLAAATGNYQGNWAKGLYYHEPVNPISDLSKVWTLENNPDGDGNGVALRNVEHRTYLFHSWGESWNFKAENKPSQNTNINETRMYIAYDGESKWTIKSAVGNAYVGPWENVFVVGAEMAGNKNGNEVSHFQMYSMPRKTFAEKYITGKTTADLSFMSVGVINNMPHDRYAWSAEFTGFTQSLDNEFAPRDENTHNSDEYTSNYFYQAWNNYVDFSGKMYCELKNLPAGTYALTAYGYRNAGGEVNFVLGETTIPLSRADAGYQKLAVNNITVGEDGKINMRYDITKANCVGLTGFTLMYGAADDVAKNEYQAVLAKANEILPKEMSEYAKGVLQGAIDTYGNLSADAGTDEYTAATDALNAAVTLAEKAVKSYAIIKSGVIPTDNIDGWSSTIVAQNFHIDTWVGNADDGSGMDAPFLENHLNAANGVLGDGVITYTLEGIDNGNYAVSALMRALSEAGNAIGGTCNFALNDGEPVDLIAIGTKGNSRVFGTLERAVKVEDHKLTLSITVAGATYNWLAIKNVVIEYYGTASPEEGIYNRTLAKANETLAKEMSDYAKDALQQVIDANDGLTTGAAAEEFTAAIDALNAAVAAAERAVKSYEIIKNGVIPTNTLDGWASTVPAERFQLNTWSGDENDGAYMSQPFLENWTYRDNGVLGDGTITYTLEGIDNGDYRVAVRMRAFSESGNVVEGTCEFALNDETPVDLISTGTVSMLGNNRIHGTLVRTAKVEDNKLTLSITLAGATFNWFAFKDVMIDKIESVTADPADGTTIDKDLKSIAITFTDAASVAVNPDNSEPVAIIDVNGETVGTIGGEDSPFTVEGAVATLKNVDADGENPIFPNIGTYTIEIPAGKFLLGDEAVPSAKIKLTYTVELTEIVVITDPENGATVETLEKIHLTYEGFEEVSPVVTAADIVVTKDGEPYAQFTGQEDDLFTAESDYGWNEWDLNLNLTEPGEYTITIPAGKMWDYILKIYFPELVLNYTVTGTPVVGINGVAAADVVNTEYFSVDGTALDDAPVKGINIVRQTLNSGKVTVKKVYVK